MCPGLADDRFMAVAVAAAVPLLGSTCPNPTVGAVLVRDGEIISTGVTQPGGRPHAEAVALAAAGHAARGATLYVTLEPCAHVSPRGPSCSAGLIEAGVARVVVAIIDPDPRTAGDGVARLAAQGIAVSVGCRAELAGALHQGFLTRLATGRPMVAASDDGNGFEAPFALGQGETFETALDRMGGEGFSRVWVRQGSPLALALAGRGLLMADRAADLRVSLADLLPPADPAAW
ncbi:MAG: bifunctional diaminohydroxyphosphoribosylaminopyrimidine deaminase/5-amino-6-(5-phosphoribosylamino)uracil reductase RibD [Hyphomonadaceae bacterium]|jgi:diaminohydroxyphosphoribosylaminopyrimidine deaminase/5-amino-6-(5-phosphoribosylamino)uracil reductase|nr:bifunctional diaminohydroxyphosphoribosylaminopyrimidine deaminase/5-amino-6-(5-phosphoribosylamino)uracil reductase RibD [Hyphomonadaceae bacterium]